MRDCGGFTRPSTETFHLTGKKIPPRKAGFVSIAHVQHAHSSWTEASSVSLSRNEVVLEQGPELKI